MANSIPNESSEPTPGEVEEPSFQVMPDVGNSELEKISNPSPDSAPPMEAEKKSVLKNKYVYLVVGVLVVLALAAGYYYFFYAKKPSTPNETVLSKLPKTWLVQFFMSETCSDQNVCGDNADSDKDGLTNYEEFKAGTNPTIADTDTDGLADGDEVKIFKTDPTLKYTDRRETVAQNDWTDGKQLLSGYDPLTPGLKLTTVRIEQMKSDISAKQLHQPSSVTLENADFLKDIAP